MGSLPGRNSARGEASRVGTRGAELAPGIVWDRLCLVCVSVCAPESVSVRVVSVVSVVSASVSVESVSMSVVCVSASVPVVCRGLRRCLWCLCLCLLCVCLLPVALALLGVRGGSLLAS